MNLLPHAPRHVARDRCREAGFTLVELTVALLAGLIVAMGIVTLSREATHTFHEEARSSAAEASLRTAIGRLRSDLERAGYMSTGNILADPNIAHAPGTATTANINPAMAGITGLASIFLNFGGSVATNGLALSGNQTPALNPDIIQISGNLTSTDQFDVELIEPDPLTSNCRHIWLSPTSPAMYRILGANPANNATELTHIFVPSIDPARQFIVRLVDETGRSQFLATCSGTSSNPGAGIDTTKGLPYVAIDEGSTHVAFAKATGTVGGVTGYGAGRSWVNPVQTVQWEITTAGATDPEPSGDVAALGNSSFETDGGSDPTKYDLMRTFYDARGAPVPDTSEVVAEYAVDLSFAFSVDSGTALAPNITAFSFDNNAANGPWALAITAVTPPQGPQRIRTVRARLVTRAAQPDRTVAIAPSPGNYSNQLFLYRYCTSTAGCNTNDGVQRWARARTVTTEVSLPNQARNYY